MPNYIKHDPASVPFVGKILSFFKSVSPQDTRIKDQPNILEVAEDYTGQDITQLKVVAGAVVSVTQADKDLVAAQEAADEAASIAARELENRDRAKAWAASTLDAQGLAMRALALTVLEEINILRAQHSLAPRTKAQLKNAIQLKINDKSADNM